MIRPPFAARVVTGLIVTAIEETRKLPTTAVTLPMTAVSQTLQVGMRLQQGIAELAIKGDEALDALFHRAQETPDWATFDDDVPDDITHDPSSRASAKVTPISAAVTSVTPTETAPADPAPVEKPTTPAATPEPTESAPATKAANPAAAASSSSPSDDQQAPPNTGRFALYSSAPETVLRSEVEATPVTPPSDAPEIVEYLDYDALTLAQLRAKIRTVDLEDLQILAEYERSHRGRAPFQTMLDNRITAAASK